ncbi:MAG: type pilus assembly protein PilM [Pseudonocardiales bacterium]|nr:type pilus assembly protein PilM [Pseudonocardiales bacterium]
MKHRQISVGKVATINSDGHAIGLDLGATSVRAAILTPGTLDGRPSVTVHGLGWLPIPPGTVVNGVVADPAVLTRSLKELWDRYDFGCDHVILGISNPQVLVRDIQVPKLNPAQRAKALPFQARDIVALPIEQVILDFVELGVPDSETNLVNGLLVATPRQPVLAAVAAVERAGLKVARVDLASFAVLRSIADEHLAVEAVIDLGAHLTTIVIHNRGVPKLVRTLARGGQELTQRLMDRLNFDAEQAEQAKYAVGLIGHDAEVASALTEGVRPLLAEIRSSINYFRSGNEQVGLERISLTGGGSGLLGLARLLSDQNGVPTTVITPMQHIRNRWTAGDLPTDESEGSASAVSVGLAMGAAA